MNQKEQVAAAICRAQSDLEDALAELERIPAFDPGVAAFAAHALNNYLSVSAGTVELLLLSTADHPDQQVRFWLEGLRHMTELMRHTVSQLMTSSPTTSAQLKFMRWDPVPMAQRACRFYQRIADRKQITIHLEEGTNVPAVWTDPVAVAAVIDNLLSNAIKYSAPGKRVWLRIASDGSGAAYSVRDEGPGLSAEDQAKLFGRGVRLTPQPTGGEPSSGYGLAVAMELTQKLGGQLSCESQLGAGCCFSLRLPAYDDMRH